MNFNKLVCYSFVVVIISVLLLSTSSGYAQYTEETDKDGNIILHYKNYSDYVAPAHELSIGDVTQFRVDRLLQANDTIQNMSVSDFNNGDPATNKKILNDKINTAIELVKEGGLYGEEKELQEIRSYVTTNMTGQGQGKVLQQINNMITATKLAAQPAPAIQKAPTIYETPDWQLALVIGGIIIAGVAGVAALVAISKYGGKPDPPIKDPKKPDEPKPDVKKQVIPEPVKVGST
ncbi:MAG: hypothetical protein HY222_03865 [Thaumarchaeota archaeon]|nr:hypothetical protein [Nitrososphaerota archaeon]MBI3641511.1 hypothetical protein [Nitrososphaerota archaeon]